MSQRRRRLRELEARIAHDKYLLGEAYADMKYAAQVRLRSPSSFAWAFGGGFMLGWLRPRRKAAPADGAAEKPRAKRGSTAGKTFDLVRTVFPIAYSMYMRSLEARGQQPPGA